MGEQWEGIGVVGNHKLLSCDSFARNDQATRTLGLKKRDVVYTEDDVEPDKKENNCGPRACAFLAGLCNFDARLAQQI